MKMKYAAVLALVFAVQNGAGAVTYRNWQAEFPWGVDAVRYCIGNGIIQGMGDGDLNLGGGLTKAQMAKMLAESFELSSGRVFSERLREHWSYTYVNRFADCILKPEDFLPDAEVTREEFAASLIMALGIGDKEAEKSGILAERFTDSSSVDMTYKKYLEVAVEDGYMYGADGLLRPKDRLRRVEAAVFIYRALGIKNGELPPAEPLPDELLENDATADEVRDDESAAEDEYKTHTPITGAAQISYEAAQKWARANGAHERFIDVAPIYWKYGELTGLRPEVLYAQAAKETGYGKYGGRVLPEMNNWAGIKTATATGDETYDHETFATPDDGVRAHFNHMCAYVGLEPVGETYARYRVVKTTPWAGTVKYVEDLGGRWCPAKTYGVEIIENQLDPMLKYK